MYLYNGNSDNQDNSNDISPSNRGFDSNFNDTFENATRNSSSFADANFNDTFENATRNSSSFADNNDNSSSINLFEIIMTLSDDKSILTIIYYAGCLETGMVRGIYSYTNSSLKSDLPFSR